MINVIIIEDESFAFEKLKILLKSSGFEVNILGYAGSIESAIKLIKSHESIDLAFLDIQLADGISFSIFNKINIRFPVIFTTAYENYAIRAFKHHSIDYLLKPIRKVDLITALQKFQSFKLPDYISSNLIKDQFAKPLKQRFAVKIGDYIKIINIENIACFYSSNKTSYILNNESRSYIISYPLDDIDNMLDEKLYFRVNRKFIININFIKNIISYTNSRLKIELICKTDEEIIVSRERVKEFKKWIEI
jgi:DNA-binding LytR/AlgR family response regulator